MNFGTKVTYNDLYRFLVSLGLLLVAVAGILPWLFLREQFDLLIDNEKLKNVSQEARSLLLARHSIISWVYFLLPWISGVLTILGFVSIGLGLSRWHNKQRIVDEGDATRLALLKQRLRPMTEPEVQQKVSNEIDSIEPPEEIMPEGQRAEVTQPSSASIAGYIQIEARAAHRIAATLPGGPYDVRLNCRLDGTEYDAVLEAKMQGSSDLVLEVKYIRQGFNYGWLRSVIEATRLRTELYHRARRRRAVPVLVIVFASKALLNTHTGRVEDLSLTEADRHKLQVQIVLISEEDLDKGGDSRTTSA